MKNFISILMLLAAIIAFTHAHTILVPGKSNPFPGHGPFNPNQPKPWGKPAPQHRFRRSDDEKKNHIKIEGQRERGSSSYNVDYGRTIHENKHGSVILHGGMNKDSHGRPDKHVGVQGQWRF
ncbi:uncharacterized protein LOC122506417 [Leptopilina heterotoma]|uniref:uncharacterized protein LOC122506417 n=1 Tax=Leptopilina heterotoma TaxID=63436 RepID=UPI001CA9FEE1|nr:uncharacterized protein LOC122506417 [Leptopilina heterotoma]